MEYSPTPVPNIEYYPTHAPTIKQYSWANVTLFINLCASIVGSLFVIYSTYRFEALRKKAFRLIFWLAVADLGANGATLLLHHHCQLQAILVQYFTTAAILWPLIIAVTLYGAVNVQGVEDRTGSYLIRFIETPKMVHSFVWGTSLATTIPPIFTGSFGPAGDWCWIRDNTRPTSSASIERFACFYIIVWIVFILSSICYCAVYRALGRFVDVNIASGQQLDIVLRLMRTLKYYPIIFLLSWLPSSLFRLIEELYPHRFQQPIFLSLFTIFKGSGIQGILDAIAYATTPAVKQSWNDVIFKICHHKNNGKSSFTIIQPLFYDSSVDSENTDTTADQTPFTKSLSQSLTHYTGDDDAANDSKRSHNSNSSSNSNHHHHPHHEPISQNDEEIGKNVPEPLTEYLLK
mmetsp:Transcript_204/g.254  ORF Transcript_204/g.254 Transcript_204/m.254 type:complete len:404 (-) Transcript_204:71-1282(-)